MLKNTLLYFNGYLRSTNKKKYLHAEKQLCSLQWNTSSVLAQRLQKLTYSNRMANTDRSCGGVFKDKVKSFNLPLLLFLVFFLASFTIFVN